jgi:hypothetical protein
MAAISLNKQPVEPMGSMNSVGVFQFDHSERNRELRGYEDRFPHMKVISNARSKDSNYRCFYYAMTKFLKIDSYHKLPPMEQGQPPMMDEWVLCEFFESTSEPQSGDLAIYRKSCGKAVHYGVYQADGKIESKWGTGSVYRHPIFCVPNGYGDDVVFYRLKPEFTFEKLIEILWQRAPLWKRATSFVSSFFNALFSS